MHKEEENGEEENGELPFRVLCLDGGGAKGFYSLGVLRELEAALDQPLNEFFHAIYGTSTGSIIASLIGLGIDVPKTIDLYRKNVTKILGAKFRKDRSAALRQAAEELFRDYSWENFSPYIGIVATNWTRDRPLIFKNRSVAAHGLTGSFLPGFGCTIADAVCASCSATPFFESCKLTLANDGTIEARDGGFSANNPSLFALTDALCPLGVSESQIQLFTLGVGHYPTPRGSVVSRVLKRLPSIAMLEKTLSTSATTTEILVNLLFPNITRVRIDERFESPELATNLLETNQTKLDLLIQRGRESYGNHEHKIKSAFHL